MSSLPYPRRSSHNINVLITVSFPESLQERIRAVSPRLSCRFIPAQTPGDVPAEVWARTEVLYTGDVLPEVGQAPALRWIQFHYAGIDRLMNAPVFTHQELVVTTLSGAAAPQVAEHIMAMMFALARKLPAVLACQREATWPQDRFVRFAPTEFRGRTVGIIGYGSIGRQLARILRPLEVTLFVSKRDVSTTHDPGYAGEATGDPAGVLPHKYYPPEKLGEMAGQCTFVVVCLPFTRDTANCIGHQVFHKMLPTSFLIDVSRGGIVNHEDLVVAIRDGIIAGAALDVFPEEPLSPGSPLWRLPNVIISPHIAGASHDYIQRAGLLFGENLRRYLADAPPYNIYDHTLGY